MKKVIENILAYYIGLTFAFSPLIFMILYFTYTEKTIGLYLCRFRIYGEKKSVNGILTDFDGGIEDADDKYE